MTEDMEKVAIELASFAMNEFTKEVEMAAHIKKEFDKMYRCGLTVSARPVRCVLISAPSMAPPHCRWVAHCASPRHTFPA